MGQDLFDWQSYLKFYRDLSESGIVTEEDAKMHWETHGKKEKRLGSLQQFMKMYPNFDIDFYRECNKEIFRVLGNAGLMTHYWMSGVAEGRLSSEMEFFKKYTDFDVEFYKSFYEDIKGFSRCEVMNHYWNHGSNEGRMSNVFQKKTWITRDHLPFSISILTLHPHATARV